MIYLYIDGPILEPNLIVRAHYPVVVNPILRSPAQHLVWDLKSSLNTAAFSSPNGVVSLESLRPQPATSPRLPKIYIVSNAFSWALRVSALQKSAGVSVGDILDFMTDFFSMPLGVGDLEEASLSHRAAMEGAYKTRTSQSPGPTSLCVHDWLLERTLFDGFAHDPVYTNSDIRGMAGEVYLRLSLKECQ